MNTDDLYTVAEVSTRLRVHPETVRRWLGQGRLKGYRPGGTKAGWRIRAADLTRFIEMADEEATASRQREQFYAVPESEGHRLGVLDLEAGMHSATHAFERWDENGEGILRRMTSNVKTGAVRADFVKGYLRAGEVGEDSG